MRIATPGGETAFAGIRLGLHITDKKRALAVLLASLLLFSLAMSGAPSASAEESPAPAPEESPAPLAEESPAPLAEESPAPAAEESPAPLAEESPALAAEESPVIRSDKDDYAPGETVTLTGSRWAPSEAVHITVDDDEGKTWRHEADVTADEQGSFQHRFDLPEWFVATYRVVATGPTSGTAATTFTDSVFATASVTPKDSYRGTTGNLYTFTINNTSTSGESFGSVRVDDSNSGPFVITACQGPVGWTAILSNTGNEHRCTFESASGSADNIPAGAGTSAFKVTASISAGPSDISGQQNDTWVVRVHTGDSFSSQNSSPASASTPGALNKYAYAWEITDAVVAGSASSINAPCPAANKTAAVGSTMVIVICGTNHTSSSSSSTATPGATSPSSLSGTFIGTAGTLATGPVGITPNVVLGNWTATTITSSAGTGKTVITRIGSTTSSSPPVTEPQATFSGYVANTSPSCKDVSITTDEDVDGSTAPDCSDVDADALTISVVGAATNGTASVDGSGKLVYDPKDNFNGTDSFTYKANDGNLDSKEATVSVSVKAVNDLPTVTNDRASQTVQHSDAITAVNIAASDAETSGADLTSSTQFKTGSGTFAAGLPSGLKIAAGTTAGTWVVSGNMNVPPETYTIRVTVEDSDGGKADTEFSVKVIPENAVPTGSFGAYTGSTYYWVPSNGTSATATLAASIKEAADSYAGDIRNAKLSFHLRDATGGLAPISGAQNLAVGLVSPNNTTVGTAAKTLQLSLKSGDICTLYTIAVTVGGSYKMDTPPAWDTEVSVCKATTGSVISNGVQFPNSGAAGFLADTSRRSSLNFNVKYNSKGTNPQGKVSLSLTSDRNPSGVVDGQIHTYYVKSTSISTFSVKTADKTASFSSKVSVQELVCSNGTCSLVGLDGGAIMQADVKDGGANGVGDTVAITVNKSTKTGGLWFSSKWDGSKTIAKTIDKGDIAVQ